MRTRGQCEVTVNMNVTCAPCFRCLKLVLDTVYTRTHYKSHIWVNMFQCAANDKSSIFVYHWVSSGVLTMSCFAWFQAKQPLFGHKSGRLHSQACGTPCWAQVCALQGVRQAWFPYRGSILEAWVSAGGWGRLLPDVNNRLFLSILSPPSQKSTDRNRGKMAFCTFASSSTELRQDGSFEADRKHFKLGACSELRS